MTRDDVIEFLRQHTSEGQWSSEGQRSRWTSGETHGFDADVVETLTAAAWHPYQDEDGRLLLLTTGVGWPIDVEAVFPKKPKTYCHGDEVKVEGNPGKTWIFGCYRPNDPERCAVFSDIGVFECDVDRLLELDDVIARRQALEALASKGKVSVEDVVDALISMNMLRPKN